MDNTRVAIQVKDQGFSRPRPAYLQLNFLIPVIVLAALVISAIFADFVAPYPPNKISMTERLVPPVFMDGGSSAHLLGTDKLGRDILSRVIHGGRISLSVALLVILITSSVGTILGILAGYMGGRLDAFVGRVTDVSLAFPGILIAMLLAVSLGPSFKTVVLAISLLGWAP